MNPMPPHASSTLDVAKETLAISEKSGDRSIKILGLMMLAMTGLATMMHAGHAIYRDLFAAKGKGDHGRGDPSPPKAPSQSTAIEETPSRRQDTAAEASWVRKARLTERASAGEHSRPERHDRHGLAQRR
jgi:hypothetical protein